MRVFVGYGYNERDKWIEDRVFPILRCAGFTVVHGKDMVGQPLEAGVVQRIDQSDAVIGFFTIREGTAAAEFNSHLWVRRRNGIRNWEKARKARSTNQRGRSESTTRHSG
jgi:hypothetical protein